MTKPAWISFEESCLARFWTKVKKTSSCWIFEPTGSSGYGSFTVRKRTLSAHKWIYEKLIGKVPSGLVLDHICRTRACVNVEHLRVVTNKENVLAGIAPSAKNARKTHCKKGHPFDSENTRYSKWRHKISRVCRTCARNNQRKNKS